MVLCELDKGESSSLQSQHQQHRHTRPGGCWEGIVYWKVKGKFFFLLFRSFYGREFPIFRAHLCLYPNWPTALLYTSPPTEWWVCVCVGDVSVSLGGWELVNEENFKFFAFRFLCFQELLGCSCCKIFHIRETSVYTYIKSHFLKDMKTPFGKRMRGGSEGGWKSFSLLPSIHKRKENNMRGYLKWENLQKLYMCGWSGGVSRWMKSGGRENVGCRTFEWDVCWRRRTCDIEEHEAWREFKLW